MITRIVFLVFVSLIILRPLSVSAVQFDYDASINPGSVIFVPNEIYANEPLRIYANIVNTGNKDITGVVSFFLGPALMAPSHPFSLRAQSVTEDVWIDWTPPEGRFNIMVKIDTTPTDQNPSNNVYITPMMMITKRPPPPPPPPLPSSFSVSLPVSGAVPSKQSPSQENLVKKVAQNVIEKITPKLPMNPLADLPTRRKEKKLDFSQPPSDQPLSETKPTELVAIGTVELPTESPTSSDTRSLTDGLPKTKKTDPARMILIFSILVAIFSLGVGGYFLHKSRA